MKLFGEFIKTTSVNGMLVLFPFFASLYLMVLIIGFFSDLIRPLLVRIVPEAGTYSGALGAISILILLISSFLVGLAARTRLGSAFEARFSRLISAVPGYKLASRIARIIFDHNDSSGSPVLVHRDGSKQIGFMMDDLGNGEMVVFFPEPPSLVSGGVEIVKASAVERLNVPARQVAGVIATFGVGTHTLLDNTVGHENQNPPNSGGKT
ncbi:MAG: DUF502 domain-containing protein [Acidobacteria bacterium]|nr:DUF502 domain-containing protein [Acidobacteriota bacterium]